MHRCLGVTRWRVRKPFYSSEAGGPYHNLSALSSRAARCLLDHAAAVVAHAPVCLCTGL